MDHSVQGYLQRLTSKELEVFLWRCEKLGEWDNYARWVPLIFDLLKTRQHPIPPQLLASWNAYIENSAEQSKT